MSPDVWAAGAAVPIHGRQIREGGPERKCLGKACIGSALIGLEWFRGQSPGVNLGAITY